MRLNWRIITSDGGFLSLSLFLCFNDRLSCCFLLFFLFLPPLTGNCRSLHDAARERKREREKLCGADGLLFIFVLYPASSPFFSLSGLISVIITHALLRNRTEQNRTTINLRSPEVNLVDRKRKLPFFFSLCWSSGRRGERESK